MHNGVVREVSENTVKNIGIIHNGAVREVSENIVNNIGNAQSVVHEVSENI